MLGPKIIEDAPTFDSVEARKAQTGIRRMNDGGYAAVRNGRLLDTFTGPGCKADAIRRAGTNRVVA